MNEPCEPLRKAKEETRRMKESWSFLSGELAKARAEIDELLRNKQDWISLAEKRAERLEEAKEKVLQSESDLNSMTVDRNMFQERGERRFKYWQYSVVRAEKAEREVKEVKAAHCRVLENWAKRLDEKDGRIKELEEQLEHLMSNSDTVYVPTSEKEVAELRRLVVQEGNEIADNKKEFTAIELMLEAAIHDGQYGDGSYHGLTCKGVTPRAHIREHIHELVLQRDVAQQSVKKLEAALNAQTFPCVTPPLLKKRLDDARGLLKNTQNMIRARRSVAQSVTLLEENIHDWLNNEE